MRTKNKPRGVVLRFAVEMEKKLAENDHKGGWDDCEPEWLLKRLREETRELAKLVRAEPNDRVASLETATQVAREAADVANFAMMIAHLYGLPLEYPR
jgi:NTP pyrophosphatase (non-canonical NTP hydrolase)